MNQTNRKSGHRFQSIWVRPIPFWTHMDMMKNPGNKPAYPIIRYNQKGTFNRAIHHVDYVNKERGMFSGVTLPDIADKNQSVILFLDLNETTIIGWLKDLTYPVLDENSEVQILSDPDVHDFQHVELPGEWEDEEEVQEVKQEEETQNNDQEQEQLEKDVAE